MALSISDPWMHDGEGEALHFVLSDRGDSRRIKLKRSDNAAAYDFLRDRVRRSPTEAEEALRQVVDPQE